jgi:hypothetical protein
MKKLMIVLLMAMVGVCFADYKTDFDWDSTDSAKIEKGLAEATQAKDVVYMDYYSMVKAFVGKDAKNITYDDLKKVCQSIKLHRQYDNEVFIPTIVFQVKRLNDFIINVINDNTLSNPNASLYIDSNYSVSPLLYNMIEGDVWRKRFVNLNTLIAISTSFIRASRFLKVYKNFSAKFTVDEIKADTILMKRAWYDNITVSDEWKQLLVQVELMNKSVQ